MMKKVAILIDNMYLENISRHYGVHSFDTDKLKKLLLDDRTEEHFKTFVFDALPYAPEGDAEKIERKIKKAKYLDKLQYLDRTEVQRGYVASHFKTCPECSKRIPMPVQKLVDVKIAIKLVSLGWGDIVDKIILITGDKDLLHAVRVLEETNTIVKLVYANTPKTTTSQALIRICPETQELSKQDIEYCRLEN